MPTLVITTTYDSTTRELQSLASLDGFVVMLPARIVTGEQHDSLTLYGTDVLSAADMASINRSSTRALSAANEQLVEFRSAAATSDKGSEVVASEINPVVVFDDALNPPA